MRELTTIEQNEISGGNIAAIAAFTGTLALIYWATRPSSPYCETLYRQEKTYRTEIVPVYNANGILIAQDTNVYENINYVPVTVCH